MTQTHRTEKVTEKIEVGRYLAKVEITHHYDGSGWDPTIDRFDIEKLDRVTRALRAGDVAAASKDAAVFELMPLAGE
jgi:hypothetical protein